MYPCLEGSVVNTGFSGTVASETLNSINTLMKEEYSYYSNWLFNSLWWLIYALTLHLLLINYWRLALIFKNHWYIINHVTLETTYIESTALGFCSLHLSGSFYFIYSQISYLYQNKNKNLHNPQLRPVIDPKHNLGCHCEIAVGIRFTLHE